MPTYTKSSLGRWHVEPNMYEDEEGNSTVIIV